MNNRESLALGDSNMKRHNEVETLQVRSSNNGVARSRISLLIHVHLRVSSKPEFDWPSTISLSDRRGIVLLRVVGVSMV